MMNNVAGGNPGFDLPKLRVRCGTRYNNPFTIDLGQRNATFIKRRAFPQVKGVERFFRWAEAFNVLPERGYSIVHSFNAVPLLTVGRPYIITFEDYMPRILEDRYVRWLETRLQRAMLSRRCVALVAMSEYARRQFRWQNRNFCGSSDLEAKMRVIYPAILLRRTEPKTWSGKLKLLFVARDFTGKGGPALLRAHEQLRRQGLPVETTVVSSLECGGDYIRPPSEAYLRKEFTRLAQSDVVHYPGMPNPDVLRLMEEADFVVIPTLYDSFGFAPLEALAGGTPVIATATCAQPEIVDDGRCGYLLPLENEPNVGRWVWTYRHKDPDYLEAYERTMQCLADALVAKLMTWWESRSNYEALSGAAIERVRSRFDKQSAREQLEQLYESCRRELGAHRKEAAQPQAR
jgi:glycosyltransferase involved in cell wall biosynthesis